MAHTILGIELGSDGVRVAHMAASFRKLQLLALHQRPLDAVAAVGEGATEPSLLDRQMQALQALVREHDLRPEVVTVGLRDAVTLRLLTLPLADPKKLDQVLPFELEGQTLAELDQQIITHTVAESGVTTESGSNGTRLLAATAPRAVVAELISRLTALGLEPRMVAVDALAPAGLLVGTELELPPSWLDSSVVTDVPGADIDVNINIGQPPLPVAVLDIGSDSTQFCVVAPRQSGSQARAVTFARSMGRGGRQLATGLRPYLRDLRQTVASYIAEYGVAPRALLVTGSASRMEGLCEHLATALELPVAPLRIARAPWLPTAVGGGHGLAALTQPMETLQERFSDCAIALALALAAAENLPQVNFRKGDLAYKTDYSFLRERAPHLLAAGLAVLLCAGLTTLASLRQLQREGDVLEKRLGVETKALFGKWLDGDAVTSELNTVIQSARGGGPSIPALSAFDLLDEISRAAPAGALDIVELNIRPKKTDIKATAASAQYVDDLAAALGKIPCFKEVEKGKLVAVRNTGADGKPVELKQFTLTINSVCP